MKQTNKRKKAVPLSAYNQGIRLLARRDHAVAELRRKLMQRKYSHDEIEEALSRLIARNFLNDERTARIWAEQESQRGGQGRVKALNRMLEHGLSRELASVALEELWDTDLEREHAQIIIQRMTASIPSHELSSPKEKSRLARRLSSRGFSMELIGELLRNLDGTESGSL
ncbi:MAG TPA: regulatory protein RecX [Bacteroidetes bacterium]|nr:regulatory protein RecX [bacterium BMS3Bbin04]HDO64413.1 regulatory protein RecX [Bacteroidota bacterium]HEX03538.1 regulatory protein RecX [Bacteroidota bacterium]